MLAGRLYVDDDDVPVALRPKRAEVVARAAQLAPDNAFVQWMAADQGSYYSSQCGPTQWPEAEVANLVRMEPDNAGALQFAVALAHAKGDQAALDDALVRMASAKRAEDHLGDETAAWRKVYVAHPDMLTLGDDANDSADDKALLRALQQTSFRSATTESALEAACTFDATSERAWQRLGGCADAGVLLATRGNSFTLRELGLKMLTAAGAQREDLTDLQRQVDWLKANASNPMQNSEAFEDTSSDRAADWHGASSDIVATERRLKRTGKPPVVPPGWINRGHSEEDSAVEAWQAYVATLIDALQASVNVRERAIGLSAARFSSEMFGDATAAVKSTESPSEAANPIVDFAAAHPDDIVVQWTAANGIEGAQANAAKANVQRLDADNAAAWELSLGDAAGDTTQVLQRMAASSRYDDHAVDALGIWLAVVEKHPISEEALGTMSAMSNRSAGTISKSIAITMAAASAISGPSITHLFKACASPGADTSRNDACVAIGHRIFDSAHSQMAVMIGERLLRNLNALGNGDRARARQIAWWQENFSASYGKNDAAYMDDYISTHSEIEALRLAAVRAGKVDPPKEWKSAAEKSAAKHAWVVSPQPTTSTVAK